MDTWILGLKNSGDWAAHITVKMICKKKNRWYLFIYIYIYIHIYIYVCVSLRVLYTVILGFLGFVRSTTWWRGVWLGSGSNANSIWLDWTMGEIILYMYTYLYDLCLHIYIIHYNSIYLYDYIYIYTYPQCPRINCEYIPTCFGWYFPCWPTSESRCASLAYVGSLSGS